MADFYWLLLGILTVWRIAHLLHAEDGPANLLVRLRGMAGSGFWGDVLDCFYCLSLWVAIPVAMLIGTDWLRKLFLWPALSAGAIFLQLVKDRYDAQARPSFDAGQESMNVLRQEPGDSAERDV